MTLHFLEIENLSKTFGGLRAVDDVSFQVARDEVVGLLGPNGAGKTTIIRLITNILKPTSGIVRFKGKEITHPISEKSIARPIKGISVIVYPFWGEGCNRFFKEVSGRKPLMHKAMPKGGEV
jgi:ABC-type branched-subunit amino acid transport system ATPase component